MAGGVVALLLATQAVAGAQVRETLASPEPTVPSIPIRSFAAPASGHMWIGARLDATGSVDVIGPTSTGAFVLAAPVTVSVDLGVAVARLTVPVAGSGSLTALGDIELEGMADIPIGPEHRLLIGGSLALPTATDTPAPCVSYFYCPGSAVLRERAWAISFREAPGWADLSVALAPSVDYLLGVPWFLLHVVGAAPIFFPIDSSIGGPQPLARGSVELMLTLEVAAALRIDDVVDVGASFLGWAMPTGVDATTPPDPLRLPAPVQAAQAAVSLFVRTDPQLNSPVGGGLEVMLDLDRWYSTYRGLLTQQWGVHAFLTGRFDVQLDGAAR